MDTKNKILIRDIVIIVAISVAISFIYNVIRTDGIPFFPKDKSELIVADDVLFGDASTAKTNERTPDLEAFDSLSNLVDANKTNDTSAKEIVEINKDTLDIDAIMKHARKGLNEHPIITFEQMKRIVKENNVEKFTIIDARRPDSYAEKHIPNAINIFPSDPDENALIEKIIQLERNKYIVVYCDGGSCELSHQIANLLDDFGFQKIFIYEGGWAEWSANQIN